MKNSLQELVTNFNHSAKIKIERHVRVLDLASEVGEVCKLSFLENVGTPVNLNLWQDELGDTLYALLSLMNDLQIDTELALKSVLLKYEGRGLKN